MKKELDILSLISEELLPLLNEKDEASIRASFGSVENYSKKDISSVYCTIVEKIFNSFLLSTSLSFEMRNELEEKSIKAFMLYKEGEVCKDLLWLKFYFFRTRKKNSLMPFLLFSSLESHKHIGPFINFYLKEYKKTLSFAECLKNHIESAIVQDSMEGEVAEKHSFCV